MVALIWKGKNVHKNKCNLEALKKAIDHVGGMQQLSLKIGVSYQTILNWKSWRSSITPLNCMRIEKATDGVVKAKDILPDYNWDEFL